MRNRFAKNETTSQNFGNPSIKKNIWHSKKESNLYTAVQSRLHYPLCYCCICCRLSVLSSVCSALSTRNRSPVMPAPLFASIRNRTKSCGHINPPQAQLAGLLARVCPRCQASVPLCQKEKRTWPRIADRSATQRQLPRFFSSCLCSTAATACRVIGCSQP